MVVRLIIGAFLMLSVFTSQADKSAEAAFWRWFQANQAQIFDFEADQERIFDDLLEQLQKVHPDLTFEFGPKEGGQREFVISADGIKEAFPKVISLADAAPTLPRWRVIKFRPRRDFLSAVTLGGLVVAPEQVQFTIERDGDKAGITLFMEGYRENEHAKYAGVGYLILDQVLGEYDVETKVGYIEFKPAVAKSKLTKRPLSELASNFDRLVGSRSR